MRCVKFIILAVPAALDVELVDLDLSFVFSLNRYLCSVLVACSSSVLFFSYILLQCDNLCKALCEYVHELYSLGIRIYLGRQQTHLANTEIQFLMLGCCLSLKSILGNGCLFILLYIFFAESSRLTFNKIWVYI